MKRKIESSWRPQILRYIMKDGSELFAIHEVYFHLGQSCGSTIDAISPKFASIEELKDFLKQFLSSNVESINCGDQNHEYSREDVELWLRHSDDPVLEFVDHKD